MEDVAQLNNTENSKALLKTYNMLISIIKPQN